MTAAAKRSTTANSDQAAKKFTELSQLKGPQTDAALYWLAYADNKLGKREQRTFHNRRNEKVVFRKAGGKRMRGTGDGNPPILRGKNESGCRRNDEELKLLALQGLMNSDPEKAVPLVEKVLNGPSSPAVKSKALFVLAQSGTPQAMEILGKVAHGQSNPELQRKAVEYLGIFGGECAEKTAWREVYAVNASDASDIKARRAEELHVGRGQAEPLQRGQKRKERRPEARSHQAARTRGRRK